MDALVEYLTALIAIQVAWAVFYLVGSAVRRLAPWGQTAPASAGGALAEVVVDTATGMAVVGFFTFAVGMVGALHPIALGIGLGLLAVAAARRGDPPWRAGFWRSRLLVWFRSITPGSSIVYLAALALGFVAVVPDLGSDATVYHMVYAIDWAQAHRLTVDMLLRQPFYANNWILLDAWFVAFGAERFTAAFSWFAATLSLLGVYAYVTSSVERFPAANRAMLVASGILSVAAVALSAIFLRWAVYAMVDAPLGFMFLACCIAANLAFRTRDRGYAFALILCGAFLIGMKISLCVLFPAAAVLVWLTLGATGVSGRRVVTALALLTVLSAPWYVKNFVQAGDPIAPTLNIAFHGVDPKWSIADATGVLQDLKSKEQGAAERIAIPVELFRHPEAWIFRERGVTLMALLIVLPGAIVGYILMGRRRIDIADGAVAAFIAYAVCYWIATSYIARYTMLFFPALAALAGSLLATAAAARPRWAWASVLALAVLAVPGPGSATYYDAIWRTDVAFFGYYHDRDSWMYPRMLDYPQVVFLSDLLQRNGRTDLRVYRLSIEVDRQYFRDRGIEVVGDVFGPDRYADFSRAIFADDLAAYIRRFRIGAFILPVNDRSFPHDIQVRLEDELRRCGFHRVTLPEERVVTFVGPGLR